MASIADADSCPFAFSGPRPVMDPKERFYSQFQTQVVDIQDRIGRLGSMADVAGERKDATDSILASISKLSLEVSDAADFIPAYDQRTYSAAVKRLTDQLNDALASLAPARPRFQFRRTAKPAPETAPPDATASQPQTKADPRLLRGVPDPIADEAPDALGALPSFATPTKNYNAEIAAGATGVGPRKPSFSSAREVALSGHTGVHIILPPSASHATASGALTDLHACVVDMSAPTASAARGGGGAAFQSLMLRNINRSLIIAGRVRGPVHITGLRLCVLVVAARQVRIHECHDVDVYLRCRSRPIIEDCTGMRFAPLPATYANDDSNDDTSATDADQWDQVDDFKWLRADPSPNWSVLPAADRLPETVWTDVVGDGGAALATDDVLKAVGIRKDRVTMTVEGASAGTNR